MCVCVVCVRVIETCKVPVNILYDQQTNTHIFTGRMHILLPNQQCEVGGGIKGSCCLMSVAYIGPKSRTERPRKTKIGTEVAHVTHELDTTFKVKGSKVKVTRQLYSPQP